MPAAAIVTIVIALVVAAALAYYLIRVVVVLRAVNDALGKVKLGVRAIAQRTEPLAELLTPVRDDLTELADTMDAVVAETQS